MSEKMKKLLWEIAKQIMVEHPGCVEANITLNEGNAMMNIRESSVVYFIGMDACNAETLGE